MSAELSEIEEFKVEALELLEAAENSIVELTAGADFKTSYAAIFRAFHSVKGGAGMMGMQELQTHTHQLENILTNLKDCDAIDSYYYRFFLAGIDAARSLLDGVSINFNFDPTSYDLKVTVEEKLPQKIEVAAPVAKNESTTIRVNTQLLDTLINLMGEMVLVRNEINKLIPQYSDSKMNQACKKLSNLTSQLQEKTMQTRLQEVGPMLDKFTRLVNETAGNLGKKIELSISGGEIEVDKSILELIKDPLTHIIRNACDHGIEMPEIRKSSGKSEVGKIELKVRIESGEVIVEIIDDGKGLSRAGILAKAIQKNLIKENDQHQMNDQSVFALIFQSGFSTAQAVSNLSGRGVGMDVVKTNIDKLSGKIEIDSKEGLGMRIKLKIPLTLSIMAGLLVAQNELLYVIPQSVVQEIVQVDVNDLSDLPSGMFYSLRDTVIPITPLPLLLGEKIQDEKAGHLVVIKDDKGVFGILIEQVIDTLEIVIKPIDKMLREKSLFSAATLLAEGEVALILDVNRIRNVMEISQTPGSSFANEKIKNEVVFKNYLAFKNINGEHCAIAIDQLERIIKVSSSQLRRQGKNCFVVDNQQLIPMQQNDGDVNTSCQYAIICSGHSRRFAFGVTEVLDTFCREDLAGEEHFMWNQDLYKKVSLDAIPEKLVS